MAKTTSTSKKGKTINLFLTPADRKMIAEITRKFGLNNGELDKRSLSKGSHAVPEQGSCVMEWLTMKKGVAFGDRLPCVDPVIRDLLIALNDSDTLGDEGRQKLKVYGMRALYTSDHEHGLNGVNYAEHSKIRGYAAANYAIRTALLHAFEAQGLEEEAAAIRSLAPITDHDSADAAYKLLSYNPSRTFDRGYVRAAARSARYAHTSSAISAASSALSAIVWMRHDIQGLGAEFLARIPEMCLELLDAVIEAGPRYEPPVIAPASEASSTTF
jgi:hypothetical protein